MGLKRGFDDKVYLVQGSTRTALPTIGDLTYGQSRTDIAVRTRASEKVRTIPGMLSLPITLTVIAGVDPEDTSGTDVYTTFKTAFDAKTPLKLAFNDGTTDEILDVFSILNFETGSPIDDLKTANVTIAPSALDVAGSGSGT